MHSGSHLHNVSTGGFLDFRSLIKKLKPSLYF